MPTIISLCLYYSPGCKKNPIAYYYIAGNLQILSIFLKYSCFSGLNELQLSSRSHLETMIEFKDFQILSRTFRQYNDTLELYQLGDDSHLYRVVRNKLVSVVGVNPPADIASGRRTLSGGQWFCADRNGVQTCSGAQQSMSCNCMTRTSQQECRGILEFNHKRLGGGTTMYAFIVNPNSRSASALRSGNNQNLY